MKELLITFLFALVVSSMVNGCSQIPGGSDQSAGGASSGGPSQIVESSDASFDADVIQANQPVLVEFGAKWCQPCQKMAPILAQVSNDYAGKLKVVQVDVDNNRRLAEQYAQGGLPTFVVFEGGKAKEMFVGYTSKDELVTVLKHYVS